MRVELIVGPMFSGKSTELQRRLRRHALAGRRVLAATSRKDTRYAEGADVAAALCTHDRARMPAVAVDRLGEVVEAWRESRPNVVGVDEVQFLPDAADALRALLRDGPDGECPDVLVLAGLDGDSDQLPFEHVCALLPLCDDVLKLRAVCPLCGEDAPFSVRLRGLRGPRELVGGADAYRASCRICLSTLG